MEDSGTEGVSLVGTSPYTYAAIGCFYISACCSDLLIIRLALAGAFAFLTLAAWSDYATDGSFATDTMPFIDGSIDLSLIFFTLLFAWNLGVCLSLFNDIWPRQKLASPHDEALFHFFRQRCGLTRLEFDEIRRHGQYLELGSDTEVPFVDSTLYLVLEGLVECETRGRSHSGRVAAMFPKRSGQFFDLKFFNIFSLPVGFDSLHFRATTATRTRLFGWSVRALAAMRDSQSPCLRPFWEFLILRSLARDSVRHHLQAVDAAGSDHWPLPERQEWWEGLPSCDFDKPASGISSDWRPSLFHIFPPKGIRNRPPSIVLERQGRQNCIEIVAKAKQDCLDRMDGEDGSWQNVLFMSTFGCFKESQSSNENSVVSSPAKSTTPSLLEEATNPSLGASHHTTMQDISHSGGLPHQYQSIRRNYQGKQYANVSSKEEDRTTPQVSNRYMSNSVTASMRPPDADILVPRVHATAVDDGQSNVSVSSYHDTGTNMRTQPSIHVTSVEGSSTVKSSELAETKEEIQSAPAIDAAWKEDSHSL